MNKVTTQGHGAMCFSLTRCQGRPLPEVKGLRDPTVTRGSSLHSWTPCRQSTHPCRTCNQSERKKGKTSGFPKNTYGKCCCDSRINQCIIFPGYTFTPTIFHCLFQDVPSSCVRVSMETQYANIFYILIHKAVNTSLKGTYYAFSTFMTHKLCYND